tara:strand:+ start:148 stop:372 length:225 start_codon:yes stop_codon:yes gene_type:complete
MATRTVSLENVNSAGERVVLQYDATLDRFKLVEVDDILTEAAEDGDISDTFVTQVEEQISVENIQVVDVDAGTF